MSDKPKPMDIDKPEKKDAKDKKEPEKKPEPAKETVPQKSPIEIARDELRESVTFIEKGVNTKDASFISRALRRQNVLRKTVTPKLFLGVVNEVLLADNAASQLIHKLLNPIQNSEPAPMELVEEEKKEAPAAAPADASKDKAEKKPKGPRTNPLPEVEMYLELFAIILLFDRKFYDQTAETLSNLVPRIATLNRRTLDLISAKLYYFYALSFERINRFAEIRSNLLAAHRTACLHYDEPSQATLTNTILRNYLHYNLYAQADKFRLNTKLPDSRSTAQHARYLYYLGVINSIQLHYGEAYADLSQAIRKSPLSGALGFRQAAEKLRVIVQLLMGEIPERAIFRNRLLQRSLKPYFELTRAVRVGDLKLFNSVMTQFREAFLKDKTLSLVERLHHNVIKTGLRNINLAYSRISIKDVCNKLHLNSEEDAEYIIAKAIGDGVIDAVIDRANKCIFSKENVDVYSTQEPQQALHKRISFCMEIYNGAVKSLRFPETGTKPKTVATITEDDDVTIEPEDD